MDSKYLRTYKCGLPHVKSSTYAKCCRYFDPHPRSGRYGAPTPPPLSCSTTPRWPVAATSFASTSTQAV